MLNFVGKGYNEECLSNEQCTAKDTNSECTGSPQKCLCTSGYNHDGTSCTPIGMLSGLNEYKKQECIPVGCVPAARCPYPGGGVPGLAGGCTCSRGGVPGPGGVPGLGGVPGRGVHPPGPD